MNTFRTISRVLVVVGMMSVGVVSAVESIYEKFTRNSNETVTQYPISIAVNGYLTSSKYTIMQKALASGAARYIDESIADKLNKDKIHYVAKASVVRTLGNAGLYAAIEIIENKIDEKLEISKKVEKMCDQLTESYYIRDGVKTVVKFVGGTVTNPQMIIHVVGQCMPNFNLSSSEH